MPNKNYRNSIKYMVFARFSAVALALALAPACSGHSRSQWDDIDYSSVYRKAGARENDPSYTPSAGNCLELEMNSCQ